MFAVTPKVHCDQRAIGHWHGKESIYRFFSPDHLKVWNSFEVRNTLWHNFGEQILISLKMCQKMHLKDTFWSSEFNVELLKRTRIFWWMRCGRRSKIASLLLPTITLPIPTLHFALNGEDWDREIHFAINSNTFGNWVKQLSGLHFTIKSNTFCNWVKYIWRNCFNALKFQLCTRLMPPRHCNGQDWDLCFCKKIFTHQR